MITNVRKNSMGTVSFDGKFEGMRKAQDFIVYPLAIGDAPTHVMIQSDTRIGRVTLISGAVALSPAVQSGAYVTHLALSAPAGQLSAEELLLLKAQIFATAHGRAGQNGAVYTDNSGAAGVFSC